MRYLESVECIGAGVIGSAFNFISRDSGQDCRFERLPVTRRMLES